MKISKFFRSFFIGFIGLMHVIATEQNMRIHLVAAAGVIVAGFLLRLASWEWTAVLLCVGLVLSAECMNSALERLADRVSLEKDPMIKHAKDCGSAAVLVLAIFSAVVGFIVIGPKIWSALGW